MPALTDPRITFERSVGRRLRDEETHRRVTSALADVAAAAMFPARRPEPRAPRISGFLEDPVESATRVALDTLLDELEDLVDTLPDRELDRLVAEQRLAELGLE